MDSNRRGLGKKDPKYYSLIISPSQKELKILSDSDLKNYAEDFIKLYAAQFNKDIDPNDLVWFGKLEHTRKYKGFKNGTSDKLPPGKKAGQFKSGDQRHIHILVRRKTELNMKLSPLAKARSAKSVLTGSKSGFDRTNFFHKCDDLMYQTLLKIDNKHVITFNDFFISRFIKSKKGSIDLARKMGGNENIISQMEKLNNRRIAKRQEQKAKAEPTKEIKEPLKKKEEPSAAELSQQRINIAIKFHDNIDYDKKIKNISLYRGNQNALRVAIQEKFGFQLSDEQIKKVHDVVRSLGKGKKI